MLTYIRVGGGLKPLPVGCYSGCMWMVYQCFLLSSRHIIGIDKRVKGCFQQTRGVKFKIFMYNKKIHAMRSNNLTLRPIAETRGPESSPYLLIVHSIFGSSDIQISKKRPFLNIQQIYNHCFNCMRFRSVI